MNARNILFKLVAAGLEVAASRALGLAENLIFSSKDIEALLIQLVSADTKDTWQTACEWVKSNKETWEAWVPDRTTCAVGKGLVDLQDNFVTSKSEAVDCKMCIPGRVSVKFENTRVCSPCAPGSFQTLSELQNANCVKLAPWQRIRDHESVTSAAWGCTPMTLA